MEAPLEGRTSALACAAACAFLGACLDARTAPVASARPVGPEQTAQKATAGARDPRWAAPLERPGLPNLHRVSAVLYRGAQPEAEGIAELEAMGVRTIVNLRLAHSDRDEIEEAGLTTDDIGYEHIRMEAWDADEDEIVEFLKIAADPARQPVFVHCKYGADRTGFMVAIYRVAVEGWTKEDASKELREGGFGFHEIWEGIPEFLRELDVERMKREAGLIAPAG